MKYYSIIYNTKSYYMISHDVMLYCINIFFIKLKLKYITYKHILLMKLSFKSFNIILYQIILYCITLYYSIYIYWLIYTLSWKLRTTQLLLTYFCLSRTHTWLSKSSFVEYEVHCTYHVQSRSMGYSLLYYYFCKPIRHLHIYIYI